MAASAIHIGARSSGAQNPIRSRITWTTSAQRPSPAYTRWSDASRAGAPSLRGAATTAFLYWLAAGSSMESFSHQMVAAAVCSAAAFSPSARSALRA